MEMKPFWRASKLMGASNSDGRAVWNFRWGQLRVACFRRAHFQKVKFRQAWPLFQKTVKAFNYNGQRNVSGERIRQARTRQRCTQSDLAARVQVSGVIIERDCISRIENGLRMIQDFELRAIAGALGVTTDWLVGEDEE